MDDVSFSNPRCGIPPQLTKNELLVLSKLPHSSWVDSKPLLASIQEEEDILYQSYTVAITRLRHRNIIEIERLDNRTRDTRLRRLENETKD